MSKGLRYRPMRVADLWPSDWSSGPTSFCKQPRKQDREVALALQLGRHTVARWRARFLQHGISGIEQDVPRPGRTRTIDPEEIIRKTTQEKPVNATHWTTRTLAGVLGISEASVRRAWHAHGLKPHLV